jgi:hypothetical protein
MRAIYFIESEGIKYYKTDTFWGKSTDFKRAKYHNDDQHDQDPIIYIMLNWDSKNLLLPDKPNNFYNNSIYGYQTLNDLGEITSTVNVKIINYDESDKLFKCSDYKQSIREDKINKIIG